MTLVHSNVFDDFMLSLHDPMPPMPNEYHDSITTPVLVTELNDRREASNLNDKIQKYNLTINVFEIKLIANDNKSIISSPSTDSKDISSIGTTSKVNLQLKIEIGDQKAKTGRKSIKLISTDQSVTFNETFTFYFNTILSQFLDHVIEFRLFQSGRYIKGTKILGKVDLDLVSLYNEPGMAIKDHLLALFSEQTSELVGYLKCDLIIDLPNHEHKDNLLPIIRPVTPLSRHTPIESHIKSMNIMVNIYSGEMPLVRTRTKDKLVSRIRSRKASGLCVSVALGDLEGSTSSIKKFSNPIWNEMITFHTTVNIDKPPVMTIKVHDKSKGSMGNFKPLTRSIDLSKICLDRGHGPIFGPSYLVVKESPKDHSLSDNCLFGKLLISIRSTVIDDNQKGSNPSIDRSNLSSSNVSQSNSEQLPSENQENSTDFNSVKQIEHNVSCGPICDLSEINYPKEDEFTFFGVLYSSDMISKKLENRKLSYEVEIGGNVNPDRCGSPSILDLTIGSLVDTVIGSDDKDSLPPFKTPTPARSTPIKGYHEQESAKMLDNSSVITSTSKTSEKSERGSVSGDITGNSETNGKGENSIPVKSSATMPLKPEATDDTDLFRLPLGDKRPLLGIEQLMIDTRSRSFVHNMIRKIGEELEIGLTDVREMALIQHQDTFRRFRGVLEDLMVHCNRFLALTVMPSKYPKNELDLLYTKYRQRELIKLSADAKNTLIILNETNLPECLSTVTGYLGRIEDLLVDPQDDFPDIIIYLFADSKRVGYTRIPVADVIFSRLENEKGSFCAKTSTYYIKSIKHPELILNRIVLYTWFGLKRHKRHSTSGLIPGYEESLQLVFFQSLDGTLPSHLIYPSP